MTYESEMETTYDATDAAAYAAILTPEQLAVIQPKRKRKTAVRKRKVAVRGKEKQSASRKRRS
jgi:hypothetical protein